MDLYEYYQKTYGDESSLAFQQVWMWEIYQQTNLYAVCFDRLALKTACAQEKYESRERTYGFRRLFRGEVTSRLW